MCKSNKFQSATWNNKLLYYFQNSVQNIWDSFLTVKNEIYKYHIAIYLIIELIHLIDWIALMESIQILPILLKVL